MVCRDWVICIHIMWKTIKPFVFQIFSRTFHLTTQTRARPNVIYIVLLNTLSENQSLTSNVILENAYFYPLYFCYRYTNGFISIHSPPTASVIVIPARFDCTVYKVHTKLNYLLTKLDKSRRDYILSPASSCKTVSFNETSSPVIILLSRTFWTLLCHRIHSVLHAFGNQKCVHPCSSPKHKHY